MKKLNVVKVGDQWGWAYAFLDAEQSRYSRHNIVYNKYNEVNLSNVDICYIHSPNISSHIDATPIQAKSTGVKVIGGYGGHCIKKYSYVDLVVTIAPQTLKSVKELYSGSNVPVIFLPESVDTNFFTSKASRLSNDFKVGWAGRPTQDVKRQHMLNKLDFTVIKKQDWGYAYFKKQRTLDDMRDFYHGLDAFVLTSVTECMPRVVLEAMACGLPVVSTNVGCIPMLLDPEWIVPVYSEADAITSMNSKLDLLKSNPGLRKKVGERNRQWVEDRFSWKVNQPMWDDVFNALCSKDYNKIIRIHNSYVNKYKNVFDDALKLVERTPSPTSKRKSSNHTLNEFLDFYDLLSSHEVDFCVLKTTCLDAVKRKEFKSNRGDLHFGFKLTNKLLAIILSNGYKFNKTRQMFYKSNVMIRMGNVPPRTKWAALCGRAVKIPNPVSHYLTTLYSNMWEFSNDI